MKYYLAIDIGASSGRHILGHLENGTLVIEEVYRFSNHVVKKDGHLLWNLEQLQKEILIGMKKCHEINKIPTSVGIDTFGVDYVLLDKNDEIIQPIYSYRDSRTIKAKELLDQILPSKKQFKITGIQPLAFNTIYQLYDDKINHRLENVDSIMFLSSYLNYFLCGVKSNELSIASTSGLLKTNKMSFSKRILKNLDLEEKMFLPLVESGTYLGNTKKEIIDIIGYDTKVVSTLQHDTAAAVRGGDVQQNEVFISSGTWSLIGVLQEKSNLNPKSLELGFTNELNKLNEVRYLKNIMGMWLITEIQNELDVKYNFQQITELARQGSLYQHIFDASDARFLAPKKMSEAINLYFKEKNIEPPKDLSEMFFCVYNSLAHSYKKAIEELEKINKKTYQTIRIFGGGSQNSLLNELTREICQKEVICGVVEATAIGNILAQMI